MAWCWFNATESKPQNVVRDYKKTMNMKERFLILLIIFFNGIIFGQNIEEINREINIPDSLTYNSEIRIYKDLSITNCTEIFRMYYSENKWNTELYKHYAYVDKNNKLKVEKIDLSTKQNLELVWLNILESNIEYLPSMGEIDYKLRGKGEFELYRGKYEISHSKITITDGIVYQVFVKNGINKNEVKFDNPETYLKHYPQVDELISYVALLSIIKNTFNIWNK